MGPVHLRTPRGTVEWKDVGVDGVGTEVGNGFGTTVTPDPGPTGVPGGQVVSEDHMYEKDDHWDDRSIPLRSTVPVRMADVSR